MAQESISEMRKQIGKQIEDLRQADHLLAYKQMQDKLKPLIAGSIWSDVRISKQ